VAIKTREKAKLIEKREGRSALNRRERNSESKAASGESRRPNFLTKLWLRCWNRRESGASKRRRLGEIRCPNDELDSRTDHQEMCA
jgi:hypothetical protein